jgi:hypothetical protein
MGINPIDGKRKYIDGLKSSDIAKKGTSVGARG